MPNPKTYDRAATALSLACIVHCLALPIAAVSLPFLAAAAEAEWIHWLLTPLAIAASLTVIVSAENARVPSFLAPASIGMLLIGGSLFAEPLGFEETPPTVIGGLCLAVAHLYRLVKHT